MEEARSAGVRPEGYLGVGSDRAPGAAPREMREATVRSLVSEEIPVRRYQELTQIILIITTVFKNLFFCNLFDFNDIKMSFQSLISIWDQNCSHNNYACVSLVDHFLLVAPSKVIGFFLTLKAASLNAKDQPVLRCLVLLKAGRVEVKCRERN